MAGKDNFFLLLLIGLLIVILVNMNKSEIKNNEDYENNKDYEDYEDYENFDGGTLGTLEKQSFSKLASPKGKGTPTPQYSTNASNLRKNNKTKRHNDNEKKKQNNHENNENNERDELKQRIDRTKINVKDLDKRPYLYEDQDFDLNNVVDKALYNLDDKRTDASGKLLPVPLINQKEVPTKSDNNNFVNGNDDQLMRFLKLDDATHTFDYTLLNKNERYNEKYVGHSKPKEATKSNDLLPGFVTEGDGNFTSYSNLFDPLEALILDLPETKLGIDTVGQSRKNASHDVREAPPCPKFNIGPWNNSTIEPDYNIKSLC